MLFAFLCALCIGVRVVGIIIPALFFLIMLIKYLRRDYNFSIKNLIFFYSLCLVLFTILFWPSLWENPYKGLVYAIDSFTSYDKINLYNFYLGDYIFAKANFWHYIPIWILISTPVFIVIFFVYGLFHSTRRIIKRLIIISDENSTRDLWRGSYELQDLTYLVIIFIPIFLTIVLKSTLYTGWRHLYFVYPFIVLISIYGIKLVYINFYKRKLINVEKIFNLSILLFLFFNFYWLYKNHPFQNNYFNILAGKKVHEKFEIDYWGLSCRFALEKILKDDQKQTIRVSNVSFLPLIDNLDILTKKQKSRIEYSPNFEESDYLINNNIFVLANNNKIKKIPKNFVIYYQLFIDDILVTTIYKRDNVL